MKEPVRLRERRRQLLGYDGASGGGALTVPFESRDIRIGQMELVAEATLNN